MLSFKHACLRISKKQVTVNVVCIARGRKTRKATGLITYTDRDINCLGKHIYFFGGNIDLWLAGWQINFLMAVLSVAEGFDH